MHSVESWIEWFEYDDTNQTKNIQYPLRTNVYQRRACSFRSFFSLAHFVVVIVDAIRHSHSYIRLLMYITNDTHNNF